jgi:ABC-2 type transport system permease protein
LRLHVFWHFVRLRAKERMEYRGAYILGVVTQILGYGSQYAVIWLLLHRFHAIHGWTWPEVAFLYSLDLFTYALGAAFTFSPMTDLERMVVDGTFDEVLVLPVNPYAYVTARMYNVGYLAHVLLSVAVLIWASTQLPIQWTPLMILYLLLTIASGSLLQAGAVTFIGAWVFTLVRARFLFTLFYRLKGFIAYPASAYGAFIQILLTVVVPLAFVNFYPASALLSKDAGVFPGWLGWLAPIVGPLVFAGAYRFWTRGVDAYQSAGG